MNPQQHRQPWQRSGAVAVAHGARGAAGRGARARLAVGDHRHRHARRPRSVAVAGRQDGEGLLHARARARAARSSHRPGGAFAQGPAHRRARRACRIARSCRAPRAADWLLVRREFYAPREDGLLPLKAGARVGASSLRRGALLGHFAPQAVSVPLRGNVPTRLRKLAEGQNVDAIVLAAAGLTRLQLDLSPFAVIELPPEWWMPAPGQGALAAQCRAGDHEIESADCHARRCGLRRRPRAGSANSCVSSRAAVRRLSAATWPAIARISELPPSAAGPRTASNFQQTFDYERTHNVTHSSAEPSPAASPSNSQKLPLARSAELYSRAEALIPAGVSSPVRAFRKVGGTPVFFREAQGAHVIDEDGNRYLDFCMAWGPLILGHAHPRVVEAVQRAAADGLAFGTAHRAKASSPSACSRRIRTRSWCASWSAAPRPWPPRCASRAPPTAGAASSSSTAATTGTSIR